jgi:hypothetical protein
MDDGWLLTLLTQTRGRSYKRYFVVAVINSDAAIAAVRQHLDIPTAPLELIGPASAAQLAARKMKSGDVIQLGAKARLK